MMSFSTPSTTGAAKPVFAVLVLTTLTPLVASHALMAEPIPYGAPIQKNGPLDGTTFPCHNGGGALTPPASGYNIFPLGSKQPLKFKGTAVHGGGSCQISITYDNPPTKDSKFKVIKSIEGGCVARNEPLNRVGAESAEAPNPDEYEFVIPDDIPTGNGTIAWTWFNKIGNREMYMSCAPLQITGTDKPNAKETFEQLPEIFKANIDNGCGTPDSKDILFPNRGKNVEKLNGKTEAFATPTGQGCQKPSAGGSGAGSGTGGGAATSTAPAAAGTTKASSGAISSSSAAPPPGGVFVTTGAPAPTGTGSSTFPSGVFITKPSVNDGASLVTGTASILPVSSSAPAAPPVSSAASSAPASATACSAPTNASTSPSAPVATSSSAAAVPSTLLTSTLPVSSSSSSPPPPATTSAPSAPGTSARAEGSSLPETTPPTGTCPASQDGWYVCHLSASSHYGKFYHRCAAGKWTDKMLVPNGMQCTIKGDITNAAVRSAPEQELSLERVDDGKLEIIPITSGVMTDLAPVEARTATAPAAGTMGTVAVGTVSMNAPVRPTGAAKRAEEDIYTFKGKEEEDQDQNSKTTETTSDTTKRRSPKEDRVISTSKKPIPRVFSRHLARHGRLEARVKHHGRPSGYGR